MKSIKDIYVIGKGPSSSHTMGPQKAASIYAREHPRAHSFEVTLYGSLAATGKGHMTDVAITETLSKVAPVEIIWQPSVFLPFHPNGMKFMVKNADGGRTDEWIVYSVGGGALSEGETSSLIETPEIYPLYTLSAIQKWCEEKKSIGFTKN